MERSAASAASAAVQRRSDYLVGIALLLLVVLLWTGSNFLTNTMLTGGYDKPFAVTFLNTSSFALYLVPFLCARSRKRAKPGESVGLGRESFWARIGFRLPPSSRDTEASGRGQYAALATSSEASVRQRRPASPVSARHGSLDVLRPHLTARPSSIDGRRPRSFIEGSTPAASASLAPAAPDADDPPLTFRETGKLAAQFTLVWFAANWSLNAGLGLTSVASGTTLSSASGFFTLALGSALGVEIFTLPKLGAVTLSFLGVILVTRADSSHTGEVAGPINAPLGDALALLSAFFYAVYVTLLKVRIGSEERVSMPLFFGFVGAFNILAMWPIGLVLHLTGVERAQLPADAATWAGVGVNMAITFVSDMAYLIAMLKSSPLIATVGLSLTIPLALTGDIVRGSHSGGLQSDLGSLMVLLSFVAVGLADNAIISGSAAVEPAAPHRADGEIEADAQDDSRRGRSAAQ